MVTAQPLTTRVKATHVVYHLSVVSAEPTAQIWGRIFDRLTLLYGVNLAAHPRPANESLLSVAERYGYINEVYAIALAEELYSDEQAGF